MLNAEIYVSENNERECFNRDIKENDQRRSTRIL